MTRAWLAGHANLATENEARGRIVALDEMSTVSLHSIRSFYGAEPPARVP
jgi:hypothetical protein